MRYRHGRATVTGALRPGSQTSDPAHNFNGTRNPKETSMSDIAFAPAYPISIPTREIAPWAAFAGLILILAVYFVGAEEGALALVDTGGVIHEFVHDGRHLLGFPCH